MIAQVLQRRTAGVTGSAAVRSARVKWDFVILQTVEDLPEEIKSDLALATHTASHGLLYTLVATFILACALLAYCAARRSRATPGPSRSSSSSSSGAPLYLKDAVLVVHSAMEQLPCKV